MPTADRSQTTRTKLLAGKELSTFHRLNPYLPQGGRYPFLQKEVLEETVGKSIGGCCTTAPVSSVSSGGGGGGGGTYIVTYLGNTNTGGSAPTDSSSPYSPGASVTFLGNSGSLTKTGFSFAGWNTAADGSGTNYVGGNTFSINANTTLYAQWIVSGIPLVYLAGTGGSGTAPPSSETYYPTFSTQPVVDNTGTFTRSGYIFAGWNTAANGSGTSYPVGSNITIASGVYITVGGSFILAVPLYAQWIPAGSGPYTLTYNDGDGGAGSPPAPVTSYSAGSPADIDDNTFTNPDTSKVFNGWNTAENGSGTSYPAGSKITMTANTTLYAQWAPNTNPLVTYDANGATGGSVPAQPTYYQNNVQVSILGQGSLTRPGYTFLGWNSSATGAGSLYAPGYTFTSKTATLYAQWAPGTTIKSCGPTETNTTGPSTFYSIPYAQVIADSNTITIYLAAYFGTVLGNVGSGSGPYGILSFVSKTVITSTTITINTNTSYSNPANDYNYSQTITNGTGVTYWPSGATISSITFPSINAGEPYLYSSPPTFNIESRRIANGCGIGAYPTPFVSGNSNAQIYFFNQGVQLNYSNGTNTQFVNSPVSALYTVNRFASPIVWSAMPSSNYPYGGLTTSTDNILTSITILPSSGSTYVNPPMPDYTVQYDPNGATGPSLVYTSIPAPQYMSSYTGTTSITISGNTGSLTKIKTTAPLTYFTFSGWNTATDGSGTNYAAGATYNGGASLILYAKWV
jgi:uncharacterized repeat protein (TIGR02543 family)